jgi:hypothetical protein
LPSRKDTARTPPPRPPAAVVVVVVPTCQRGIGRRRAAVQQSLPCSLLQRWYEARPERQHRRGSRQIGSLLPSSSGIVLFSPRRRRPSLLPLLLHLVPVGGRAAQLLRRFPARGAQTPPPFRGVGGRRFLLGAPPLIARRCSGAPADPREARRRRPRSRSSSTSSKAAANELGHARRPGQQRRRRREGSR